MTTDLDKKLSTLRFMLALIKPRYPKQVPQIMACLRVHQELVRTAPSSAYRAFLVADKKSKMPEAERVTVTFKAAALIRKTPFTTQLCCLKSGLSSKGVNTDGISITLSRDTLSLTLDKAMHDRLVSRYKDEPSCWSSLVNQGHFKYQSPEPAAALKL
jgi:hypothetical protein